jgi:hypothetical protein
MQRAPVIRAALCIDRSDGSGWPAAARYQWSEAVGKLGERAMDSIVDGQVDGEFVMGAHRS